MARSHQLKGGPNPLLYTPAREKFTCEAVRKNDALHNRVILLARKKKWRDSGEQNESVQLRGSENGEIDHTKNF